MSIRPSMVPAILYYDDLNPQARSCLMLIKLLHLNVQLRNIELYKGDHLTDEYLKINPARTVPSLVHGNLILTDSHTILMYLCDNFPNVFTKQLFPHCFKRRMLVVNRLFFESSVLFRRHSEFMTEIVRKTFVNIEMDFHRKKIMDAYGALDAFLKDTKFVAGDRFTIADISMVTTVGALDLMFPIDEQSNQWPQLHSWFQRMRSMPEYKFNYDGIEKQRTIVEQIGKFEFPSTVTRRTQQSILVRPSTIPRLTLADNDAHGRECSSGAWNWKNGRRITTEEAEDEVEPVENLEVLSLSRTGTQKSLSKSSKIEVEWNQQKYDTT